MSDALWLSGLLWAFGMLYRNKCVHDWRIHLLNEVMAASLDDLHNARNPKWRLEAYDSMPSYGAQFWQFWRGLDTFATPQVRLARQAGWTNHQQ